MNNEELKEFIRDIPDFPKPGIVFKDITPLLSHGRALAATVDNMAAPFLGSIDVVLGIESRGFIVGAAVAYRLGVGMAIARKPGKLPFRSVAQQYQLEYGVDSLEIHQDAIVPDSRVLIVDDLLATGGTAEAALGLVSALKGQVAGCSFIIELGFLGGRSRLGSVNCRSLIRYD
ncbi:MAG TPA: adenine phosphoribosyltransferase [Candidatus Binataceae bacterium]|jgi:adenine phosphoribosyltransferase|nr:adenine phosphoribosyltransferase [Candidatus Binataceae bacterium]